MAKRRKQKKEEVNEDLLVDLNETTDKVSSFFEENQSKILGVLVGLLIVVGGFFAYKNFIQKPKMEKAVAEMFKAELQFSRDSFAQALTNPGGGYLGFLDIIDEYGGTPTANIAQYYAGVSYLNLGEFQNAIDYLEDFSTNDEALSITKFGAMGDAYAELNDMAMAEKMYKKAINQKELASVSALYYEKLALLNMKNGNKEESRELFSQLKSKFPNTVQARDAEKYMAMLK